MQTDAADLQGQILDALIFSAFHIATASDVCQLSIYRPQHICSVRVVHALGWNCADAWLEQLIPLPEFQLLPVDILLPEVLASVKVD